MSTSSCRQLMSWTPANHGACRVRSRKPSERSIRRATPASPIMDLKGCSLALIYETLDRSTRWDFKPELHGWSGRTAGSASSVTTVMSATSSTTRASGTAQVAAPTPS